MTDDTDTTIAAALLKRRLRHWRIGSAVAFAAAVLLAGGISRHHDMPAAKAHLALLKVHGTIGSDVSKWTKALDKASHDATVKGLLLDIDSPGGSVTGGEELHDAIERFAGSKPVVASMGGLGASAGYMIAVPAKDFAERSTLTGSIGVIMQAPDVSALLDKVGVNVDQLVSGPLKGQPSLVKPLSPAGRDMLQGVVNDLFGQFVLMVSKGRHMPEDKVRALADGRPYTGQQALGLGLIDTLGNKDDARKWLATTCALPADADLHPIGEESRATSWRRRLLRMTGSFVGGVIGIKIPDWALDGQLPIDGPIAIWKP